MTKSRPLRLVAAPTEAPQRAPNSARRLEIARLLQQTIAHCHADVADHQARVEALARAVALEVGLASDDVDEIAVAAALHDIGKIAIPATILTKPGPLTANERELVEQHPVTGERILAAAPGMSAVAKLVRSSHERWDGQGYPDRLAADEVPLGARIIAACDALDVILNGRPYAPPRRIDEALVELRCHTGSQFDRAVIRALLNLHRARELPVFAATPYVPDTREVRAEDLRVAL